MAQGNITLASTSDCEDIAAHNQSLASETEGVTIPTDTITKGVRMLLEDSSKGHYYVVKDESGAVIAQLMITYEWSDWRCANVWWIQSVYVKPDHRRKGLFTALYKHAKAESQKAGACGLRLYADFDNKKAHQTYEALGMKSHYQVFEDLNTDY